MFPAKNKKNLEGTVEELRKFSFSYLKKYSPSKQQLRTYLLKKYFDSPRLFNTKSELLKLIDLVISNLEKNKFVSDKFYAESKTRNFIKRGYSINKIRNYLIGKGISKEKLTARGYGATAPIDSNESLEGRQNNRRTEFEIIGN